MRPTLATFGTLNPLGSPASKYRLSARLRELRITGGKNDATAGKRQASLYAGPDPANYCAVRARSEALPLPVARKNAAAKARGDVLASSAARPIPAGSFRLRSAAAAHRRAALPGFARSAGHRRGDLAGNGGGSGLHRIARKVRVARGGGRPAVPEHLADDRQAHPARCGRARERVAQIVRPHVVEPGPAARIARHSAFPG
jgi:hypothetical protein